MGCLKSLVGTARVLIEGRAIVNVKTLICISSSQICFMFFSYLILLSNCRLALVIFETKIARNKRTGKTFYSKVLIKMKYSILAIVKTSISY